MVSENYIFICRSITVSLDLLRISPQDPQELQVDSLTAASHISCFSRACPRIRVLRRQGTETGTRNDGSL